MWLVLSLVLVGQVDAPDQDEAKFVQDQRQKWNKLYKQHADSYTVVLSGDPEKTLKLRAEPVLQWSNPVRRRDSKGLVFVWTHDGRAELVGTVFSHLARDDNPDNRILARSFHSLSLEPMTGVRRGSSDWKIKVPGIDPKPIPEAPPPAKTAALRLAQMRELVREFSAMTTLEGVEQELRLLTQPLYRNEGASMKVLDGGLFTFVTGTDPELMVLIEARNTENGPVWHYATGRFSTLPIEVRHKQAVVLKYDPFTSVGEDTPYFTRHGPENLPGVLP